MDNNKKINRIAVYGMLIALAMILSYVESLLPAFFAIPGIKIGLTNVVVLFALYKLDVNAALLINLVRIVLVGFIFGNGVSIIYSLAGGMLSVLVMIVALRLVKLRLVSVSIFGGVAHNIGQIIAAVILLGNLNVGWYMTILWFSGIACGAVVGIIAAVIVDRIPTAAAS